MRNESNYFTVIFWKLLALCILPDTIGIHSLAVDHSLHDRQAFKQKLTPPSVSIALNDIFKFLLRSHTLHDTLCGIEEVFVVMIDCDKILHHGKLFLRKSFPWTLLLGKLTEINRRLEFTGIGIPAYLFVEFITHADIDMFTFCPFSYLQFLLGVLQKEFQATFILLMCVDEIKIFLFGDVVFEMIIT